ncbi:hypothetical protein GPECTOR_515g490 [Gonium pectorale]|uniref:Fungal lipase-type domain-containing protein n=1 Tax=Gonium pectorale TaxID=33097 RepID=A0A150FUR0_GONPE|nr:hypothetical protein GPECTOR_515g490 [Gonium pectorale]|eukprot:KXZ41373.1 hypothetical protein GPECTOR_515g490 [Gonium pectorale]
MGCGASTESGAAAPTPAPGGQAGSSDKQVAPATDGFVNDLLEFVLKLLTDESYSESLLGELQKNDNPENKVERMLKVAMSMIGTVANIKAPQHEMGDFLIGCALAFFVHVALRHTGPQKVMDLAALQELGYHIDAKWASAVYDKEAAEDPKAALAEAMAQEPFPQSIKPEDVAYFRPTSELGRPAVAVALDHARGLILVVTRGTATAVDAITDLAGTAVEWCGGYAHEAVSLSARTLFDEVRDEVLGLKAAHPTYGVRTVGHSLGGGVSGCMALLMHRDAEFADAVYGATPQPGKKSKGCYMITSSGFGSAAVLSRELTEEVHRYATTIVHDSDLVPRLCTDTISDMITLADELVEVFKVVAALFKELCDGKTPDGIDDLTAMALVAKAVSDPAGLLRELLDEKLEKAGAAVQLAADLDPKRLYAPGRLVLLARPETGSRYTISRGSMAGGASQLLLKGSMLADHAVTAYLRAVAQGEVVPAE